MNKDLFQVGYDRGLGVRINPKSKLYSVLIDLYHSLQKLKGHNMNKKGIYLASYKAYHPNHDIVYQDINGKRDMGGDMMDVDLTPYAFIIATPPCNYYSRANYRRETSEYAQATKHLLPSILKKLYDNFMNVPFIVENVQNSTLIPHDWDDKLYVYYLGNHTYWSNIKFETSDLKFIISDKSRVCKQKRQGGYNVHIVIERFLETIEKI